jgi:hypothetical protein
MKALILLIPLVLGATSVEAVDTDTQKKGCEHISCPPPNDSDPTSWSMLLPNPYSCESYCHCDNGKAIYMPCPTGTQFNAGMTALRLGWTCV